MAFSGLLIAAALLITACSPASVVAEEAWPRWYWAVRLGTAILPSTEIAPGVGGSRTQQANGMSVGLDWNPYLGTEIAADLFEVDLTRNGQTFGEYGTLSLVPQIRVRYPLTERLTPYVLGGVGVSFNEFNDRKRPGLGISVHAKDTAPVGTLGIGLDYALSDDIALGAEVRYLVSRGHEVEIAGRRQDAQTDALLTTASLRLLFPRHTSAGEGGVSAVDTAGRYYLTLRLGGATVTDRRIGGPYEAEPENASLGDLSLLVGVGVGVDLTSHLSVEVAADGYEPIVRFRGVGSVGEYAIYAVMPQARFRYPVLDGRLVPYVLAGVGASYAEFNDRKGVRSKVHGTDFGIAAAIGGGFEYFLTQNIALGMETKYLLTRGHQLRDERGSHETHVDAFLAALGLRVYFGSLSWLVSR